MQVRLDNATLSLVIETKGAELISAVRKSDQTEYMWQAFPEIWGRHAPILFPIVGRLKDNQYTYEGQTYQMGQHGFARDKEFDIVSQSEDTIVLRLSDDDQTRQMYPFSFALDISYHLAGEHVEITYLVHNPNDKALPFSIGAHPGFSCPLVPDEILEDYVIEFEKEETASIHLLDNGLFSGAEEPYLNNSRHIPVTKNVFDRDALVFHELKSSYVRLLSQKSDRYVEISLSGFPYLGLWAKPGAPYVCLEPWQGLADYTDASGELTEKAGIHLLRSGQTYSIQYSITFA